MNIQEVNLLKYEMMYKLKPGAIKHAYNIFGNSKTLEELIKYEVELENRRKEQIKQNKCQREQKEQEIKSKISEIIKTNKKERKEYYIETDKDYALSYLNNYDFTPEEKHRVAIVGEHKIDSIMSKIEKLKYGIDKIYNEFETESISNLISILKDLNRILRNLKSRWGLEQSEIFKLGSIRPINIEEISKELKKYTKLSISMSYLVGYRYETVRELRETFIREYEDGIISKLNNRLKEHNIFIEIDINEDIDKASAKITEIRRLHTIMVSDKLIYGTVNSERIRNIHKFNRSRNTIYWEKEKLLNSDLLEGRYNEVQNNLGIENYNKLIRTLGISDKEVGFYVLITDYVGFNMPFIIGTIIKFSTGTNGVKKRIRKECYSMSVIESGNHVLKKIGV